MAHFVDIPTTNPLYIEQYGSNSPTQDISDMVYALDNVSVAKDIGLTPAPNLSGTLNGLKIIYEPYELVWTPQVVFRVTTIVVIMVLTILGNTTLITIIMYHPKLRRKRVNVFLVNLAIGDLMVCFVTMTTEILFVAFGEWVLGAVSCKVMVYGQMVTLASATFLLTGMSIDRYQVIVKPLQSLRGPPKIWRKVLVAWVLALIFATPQLFIFLQTDEGVHPDGKIKHMCRSKGYTAKWQRKLYFTFLATYILIIPTIIMSYCYTNIIKVVWMRTGDKTRSRTGLRRHLAIRFNFRNSKERTTSHQVTDTSLQRTESSILHNSMCVPKKLVSASKRNVIKMTLTVIVGFVVCWTPYFVVSLIRIYSDYTYKLDNGLSVAEIMALVHSALNPILYGMFSTKAARRMCSKLCKCCNVGHHKGSPQATIVSDDDTSAIEGKRHSVNAKNKNLSVVLQEASESCSKRFQRRFGQVFCKKNKRRKRPGTSADSNIPLLIYGRLMNGHTADLKPNNQDKPQPPTELISPTSRSILVDGVSEAEPTKHGLDIGSVKGKLDQSTESDQDMVEYLSTL